MKALLDIEIAKYHEIEPSNETIKNLFYWLDELGIKKCIQADSAKELGYLQDYEVLSISTPSDEFISKLAKAASNSSESNMDALLFAVHVGLVDVLITDDGRTLANAEELHIGNKVKENEIKSPLGSSKWSSSTIKGILENEKYIGDVILQKTYKRDFLTQRRVRNTGQAPQKYVENNHPAIVDKLTWNAVQAEIERRNSLRSTEATGKGRYDMRYAFSGVIECGECNSNFRRHNYTNGNKIERTWACKEHLKGNKYCTQEILKEEVLEEMFVNTLNRLLLNRDKVLCLIVMQQEHTESRLAEMP